VCAGSRGLGLRGHRVSRGHRTVFALPGTNDQYYERMDAGERKSRLKRIRQLERRHTVHVDVIHDPESVVEEFERFAVLHAHQWQAVGKGGHFEAWPRALEYNRALVERCAAHGRVRFYRMLVDDQVVASRYTFRLGDRVYSELPARLIGEPWDKRGVGVTSLIKFVEQCIGEGISVIDSGLGAYEHKVSVGGQEVPVHVWRYWRPGISKRLKAFAWIGVSRCVLAVCQKIYYRRTLPRLPATVSRSQTIAWLKHDY
jgi:CelD/BcsL family acetyltransferase involved in cellulose biosynthesis